MYEMKIKVSTRNSFEIIYCRMPQLSAEAEKTPVEAEIELIKIQKLSKCAERLGGMYWGLYKWYVILFLFLGFQSWKIDIDGMVS